MSERTKLVILMVLLGVLLIAAAFAVFGPKGLARKGKKASTSNAIQEEVVAHSLPTMAAFGELAAWLAPEKEGIKLASVQVGPIFGLVQREVVGPKTVSETKTALVKRTYTVQPPALQGIFWSANRPSALIDGERYLIGQKIKNSNFTVVDISTSVVKLRTDGGEDVILSFLK